MPKCKLGSAALDDTAALRVQVGPWKPREAVVWRAGTRALGCQRLKGRVLELVEILEATTLWEASQPEVRKRLLQAGGPGTGSTWCALPDAGGRSLPNGHWRVSTRARLGLLRAAPGARCGMPRADGKPCGALLDPRLRHASMCKAGPARLRPHGAVQAALADELGRAGAYVDTERIVPELTQLRDDRFEDAVLDVTAWWPGTCIWYLIDVTVRYPGASRYCKSADEAGQAARIAEGEKHTRYGESVLPLAFEPLGRLGAEGQAALEKLAAMASCAPLVHTRRGLVAKWRQRLERALLFATADVVMLANSTRPDDIASVRRTAAAAPALTAPRRQHPEAAGLADLARQAERLEWEAAQAEASLLEPPEA